MDTVELKTWDYDQSAWADKGTISLHLLAQNLTAKQFATLIDNWLNNISRNGFVAGKEVGETLRSTHRTLQREAVLMACGILVGIANQTYTDPRNADAIASAQKIAKMIESGELPFGAYL